MGIVVKQRFTWDWGAGGSWPIFGRAAKRYGAGCPQRPSLYPHGGSPWHGQDFLAHDTVSVLALVL